MYNKYTIILCLCVNGILCDLGKEEGADCEWEGLEGKCVKDTRCMTTLETPRHPHPLCSKNGEDNIICCTDCELVNDTRNALISPTSGVFWKNGQKARDSCLQYIKDLPYQCKKDTFYTGISRKLNEDKKCYEYDEWTAEGEPDQYFKPKFLLYHHPTQVLFGYGDNLSKSKFSARGVMVSDRYILTAAHARSIDGMEPYYIIVGGNLGYFGYFAKMKRFIPHPEYRPPAFYHDIALVEVDEPIEFHEVVLPVCLHVDDEVSTKETFSINWSPDLGVTQKVDMEELSEEECKAGVGKPKFLKNGYNHTTQMCYGIKMNATGLPSDFSEVNSTTCKSYPGQPAMVDTQFSSCVYTTIGVASFGTRTCGTESRKPSVYLTRISYYLPWIESIVWP